MVHPFTYVHPNALLRYLPCMSQLETLMIAFSFSIDHHHDVEGQLSHMTPITFPSLLWFGFQGGSTFMEVFVRRINTPRLRKLKLDFFTRPSFCVSSLLQFINTLENLLKFDSVKFNFLKEEVHIVFYPREDPKIYALSIIVDWWDFNWQVSCVAAGLFSAPSRIFSAVEHLILEQGSYCRSIDPHYEFSWRKILKSLSNVETLHVDEAFVVELSRSLRLVDGEQPLGLLPELQELTYSGMGNPTDAFTSIVDARQNAGRPVTLVYHDKT